jgi:hypothetical protein
MYAFPRAVGTPRDILDEDRRNTLSKSPIRCKGGREDKSGSARLRFSWLPCGVCERRRVDSGTRGGIESSRPGVICRRTATT